VNEMELIRANQVSKELLINFLQGNQNVNEDQLLDKGHVVVDNDRLIGCFVLEEVEDNQIWLQQLYVIKEEAMKLPILIEAILTLAKQQAAMTIYVNSHQLLVDIILESLQFRQEAEGVLLNGIYRSTGKWWTYPIT